MMMVLFQGKIIYMPSIPPFSRSEKVEDYLSQCRPISWREHAVTTADNVEIKLLHSQAARSTLDERDRTVLVYFHG